MQEKQCLKKMLAKNFPQNDKRSQPTYSGRSVKSKQEMYKENHTPDIL